MNVCEGNEIKNGVIVKKTLPSMKSIVQIATFFMKHTTDSLPAALWTMETAKIVLLKNNLNPGKRVQPTSLRSTRVELACIHFAPKPSAP